DRIDSRSGRRLGPATGDPRTFTPFDELFDAYRKQLEYIVGLKIEGNSRIERLFAEYMPAPFLSIVVEDCIERGEDYNGAGPRYPATYIQGVGLGTTTDAMSAIEGHVFSRGTIRMGELVAALDADFVGHESARRLLLRQSPRFGNDDERADRIARALFDAYFAAIDARPITKGGRIASTCF
ncbi:pyruvate formate lyase family protein, partial [Candidatus Bipolaricaulota bacterium]|nr:pyruvate formate lyase family protein [Candidatus Bipolaricaulota bacterium]